ncbi:MAG: hypothetical protein QNK40_07130 [Desulfobacterales bacterium]|nr:hypothetical protein [Desulfobacterales bacterium]
MGITREISRKKMVGKFSILSCCVLLLFIATASGSETLQISEFSASSLEGWEEKKFKSSTSYLIKKIEDKEVYLLKAKTVLLLSSKKSILILENTLF